MAQVTGRDTLSSNTIIILFQEVTLLETTFKCSTQNLNLDNFNGLD